jgi:hypothetical protein
MSDTLDADVRLAVYRAAVERGHPPAQAELAAQLDVGTDELRAALRRLASGKALLLSPDGEQIRVAPPFSFVPTPFAVTTAAGTWWGNCAWEAFGVAAQLGVDARIRTSSGAAGDPLEITIAGGLIEPAGIVMHVSVPTALWWHDVAFT